MAARRTYPPKLRRRILVLARKGRSAADLAREFEPSAATIRSWIKQAEAEAAPAAPAAPTRSEPPRAASAREYALSEKERAELVQLREEMALLREDHAILKRVVAWMTAELETARAQARISELRVG